MPLNGSFKRFTMPVYRNFFTLGVIDRGLIQTSIYGTLEANCIYSLILFRHWYLNIIEKCSFHIMTCHLRSFTNIFAIVLALKLYAPYDYRNF